MATTAADAIRRVATQLRPMICDEKCAVATGTQAAAARITAAFTKVNCDQGAASDGSSLVLPNLISNEAGSGMYIVANQSANTVAVYCALGDTLNGSANSALTIVANGFGIFVKEHVSEYSYVAPDWAAAAFT